MNCRHRLKPSPASSAAFGMSLTHSIGCGAKCQPLTGHSSSHHAKPPRLGGGSSVQTALLPGSGAVGDAFTTATHLCPRPRSSCSPPTQPDAQCPDSWQGSSTTPRFVATVSPSFCVATACAEPNGLTLRGCALRG